MSDQEGRFYLSYTDEEDWPIFRRGGPDHLRLR